MVLLTPSEPSEFNAFETIVRLSLSQNERNLPNDSHTQTASNAPIIANNNVDNTSTTKTTQPHDPYTIILQQFSMIIEELKKFTNKASSDNYKDHTGIKDSTGKHRQTYRKCNISSTNKSTKYHYLIYLDRY